MTLGAARGVYEKFGKSVGLVQIDAHADLRHNYEGNPYSHASVIRKVHELTGWEIYQVGIRALCEEELIYQKQQKIQCLTGREAAIRNISTLTLPESFPEHLYITIDVDGLDSSIMPATGTPVPGGPGMVSDPGYTGFGDPAEKRSLDSTVWSWHRRNTSVSAISLHPSLSTM